MCIYNIFLRHAQKYWNESLFVHFIQSFDCLFVLTFVHFSFIHSFISLHWSFPSMWTHLLILPVMILSINFSFVHLFTRSFPCPSPPLVPLWERICFMDEWKTVRSLLAWGSAEPVIGQNRSQHLTIPRELPLLMLSFKGGSPRLISCQAQGCRGTPVSGKSLVNSNIKT